MSKNRKTLKELGTISHKTSTNKLIVPTKKSPKIGLTVVNGQNKKIGWINDVIGSTKSPYASIKTNNKCSQAKIGQKIFISPKNNQRRKKNARNSKKKKTIRKTKKNS